MPIQDKEALQITESILSLLAEPVLVLDATLQALIANPAFYETMQLGEIDVRGKSVEEIIGDRNGSPHLKDVLKLVADSQGDVGGAEVACNVPEGESKLLSVDARRVAPSQGTPELILVELRDVTRAKETQQQLQAMNQALQSHSAELERTNKELDAFTHSVSHDLRTPLRLTNRIAHLMLADYGAQMPAGAIEMVSMILGSTEEMAKLIESLLRFSQISQSPLKKRNVDMRQLAQEALDELRDDLAGREVNVVIDELAPCLGDRILLKQAILNLLENALKFTRECKPAEIHIGCVWNGDETVYFVRDNGLGFDMSHSDDMFLVFHRLHKSHQIEGSGVGLALVKRIVERHGGRVWADGERDRGATFYFTLHEKPVAPSAPAGKT